MDDQPADTERRLERIEARLDHIADRIERILELDQWGHSLADIIELHMHKVLATSGVKSWLRSLTVAELSRRLGTEDLSLAELKVFSHNGEDGILVEILRRVGVGLSYFIEFGAGDGAEGNCAFLARVLGWRGLLIEADETSYDRLAARYANNGSGYNAPCERVT